VIDKIHLIGIGSCIATFPAPSLSKVKINLLYASNVRGQASTLEFLPPVIEMATSKSRNVAKAWLRIYFPSL